MTKGVLIVESRPASPDDAAAFHRWYEDTHIPEILSVDGFVSARRFESLDGDSFLVLYEITGDVEAAKGNLAAALKSGSMSRPAGRNVPRRAEWFDRKAGTDPREPSRSRKSRRSRRWPTRRRGRASRRTLGEMRPQAA